MSTTTPAALRSHIEAVIERNERINDHLAWALRVAVRAMDDVRMSELPIHGDARGMLDHALEGIAAKLAQMEGDGDDR